MSDPLDNFLSAMVGGYPTDTAIVVADDDGQPEVIGFLVDNELDIFLVKFDGDGCFDLITKEHSYISLSKHPLKALNKMRNEAAKFWEQLETYYDEQQEQYVGWQHLLTAPAATPEIEAR